MRDTSQLDNCKNQKLPINNKSGFVGVRWHEKKRRWVAAIKVNNGNKHLGSFKTFEEAVAVRKQANVEYGFHENHGKPLTPG